MLILSPGERVYERSEYGRIAINQSVLDAKCIDLMNGGLKTYIIRLRDLYDKIKKMGRKHPRVETQMQVSTQEPTTSEEGLLNTTYLLGRAKTI